MNKLQTLQILNISTTGANLLSCVAYFSCITVSYFRFLIIDFSELSLVFLVWPSI